jgi:hypothetical protein
MNRRSGVFRIKFLVNPYYTAVILRLYPKTEYFFIAAQIHFSTKETLFFAVA